MISSEDIYVVVRLKNSKLQYLTKQGIWSEEAAKAKKFRTQLESLEHLTDETKVWRMQEVTGEPGMYRVIAEFETRDTVLPPRKKHKKK